MAGPLLAILGNIVGSVLGSKIANKNNAPGANIAADFVKKGANELTKNIMNNVKDIVK